MCVCVCILTKSTIEKERVYLADNSRLQSLMRGSQMGKSNIQPHDIFSKDQRKTNALILPTGVRLLHSYPDQDPLHREWRHSQSAGSVNHRDTPLLTCVRVHWIWAVPQRRFPCQLILGCGKLTFKNNKHRSSLQEVRWRERQQDMECSPLASVCAWVPRYNVCRHTCMHKIINKSP